MMRGATTSLSLNGRGGGGGDGVGVVRVCYPTRNEGSGSNVWPGHSYRPMRRIRN